MMSFNKAGGDTVANWKVLWETVNRETLWNVLRNRKTISSPRYYVTGDYYVHSHDNNDERNDIEKATGRCKEYELGEWESDGEDNKDSFEENTDTGVNHNREGKTGCQIDDAYSDDGDTSWESVSDSSDTGMSFEDYMKSVKESGTRNDNLEEEDYDYMPYSSLSDCLLRDYCSAISKKKLCAKQRAKKRGKTGEFTGDLKPEDAMSLEERVPLMQVVDTIDEMNQVLKIGKLTPRMERILEYKMENPYEEGYEEEIMGWCPWLVYKIERFLINLWEKQWPVYGLMNEK